MHQKLPTRFQQTNFFPSFSFLSSLLTTFSCFTSTGLYRFLANFLSPPEQISPQTSVYILLPLLALAVSTTKAPCKMLHWKVIIFIQKCPFFFGGFTVFYQHGSVQKLSFVLWWIKQKNTSCLSLLTSKDIALLLPAAMCFWSIKTTTAQNWMRLDLN